MERVNIRKVELVKGERELFNVPKQMREEARASGIREKRPSSDPVKVQSTAAAAAAAAASFSLLIR